MNIKPLFTVLVALFLLSLTSCGPVTPAPDAANPTKPTATKGPDSAPEYKEIRAAIRRLWHEVVAAYATATPLGSISIDNDTLTRQSMAGMEGIKGKQVGGWQGWLLEVHPTANGYYTATVDMDEFYEDEPPLGFEYRAIRLIGLTDVVLSDLDKETAQKVSPGQKIELSGTIQELKDLGRYDSDKPAVDPAVRWAVVLTESKLTPVKAKSADNPIVEFYKEAVITLKNPVCQVHGIYTSPCYTYNLIVYGSGKVVYTEEEWTLDLDNFGQVTRTETATVDVSKVQQLVAQFEKIGYFSLKDDYSVEGGFHDSAITTSITIGTRRKSVFALSGDPSAPRELWDLAAHIDALYKPARPTPTVLR